MLVEEIKESLKSLTSKHGFKKLEIEKECGLPQNSLAAIMTGKKKFPMKHKEKLQEYCKAKEIAIILGSKPTTIPYLISERDLQASSMASFGIMKESENFEEAVTDLINLAGKYKAELEELKRDMAIELKSRPPKNLAELKLLCPSGLEGFDRSQWISTERQKYNI